MQEKTLLIAAVVCSVLGVVVLYLISGNLVVEESSLAKITGGEVDGSIVAKGRVTKIIDKEKLFIVQLTQQETLDVVMFKKDNEHITLTEGAFVEVRGNTGEYNGKPQIVAEEVRVVG